MRTGPDRKRKQFDQVGISGHRVGIRNRQGLSFLQMHLRYFLQGARNHQPRVSKVEALANDARKVQDLGDDHSIIPTRKKVSYVVAQHPF